MKNVIVLLAVVLAGYSASAAVTSNQIRSYEGKYYDEVVANVEVRALVQDTLTAVFVGETSTQTRTLAMQDFEKSMATMSQGKLVEDRYLVLAGCEAHNCGFGNRALIVFDAYTDRGVLIVRKNMIDITNNLQAVTTYASAQWNSAYGQKIPASVQEEIDNM